MKSLSKKSFLKISRFFRKTSITKRFILLFIIVFLLPQIVMSLYNFLSFKDILQEKVIQASEQAMRSFNLFITEQTTKYQEFSHNTLSDQSIRNLLENSNDGIPKEALDTLMVEHNKLLDLVWNDSVDNIMILNKKRESIYSVGQADLDFTARSMLVTEMNRIKADKIWLCADGGDGEYFIILAQKVFASDDSKDILGFLIYVFDEKKFFENIYENLDFGGKSQTFILSQEFQYFSSQYEADKVGTYMYNEDINIVNELVRTKRNSFVGQYNGEDATFLYEKNENLDWYVVTVIADKYMNEEVVEMVNNLMKFNIPLILISFLIIIFISSTIIVPINKLMVYTEKIRNGQFDCEIECVEKDEIGQLTQNNKDMVNQLVKLMEEVKKNEIRRREMELDNLQYQINPHFIFNTLTVFKNIAVINGITTISNGMEAFSALLRQTIVNRSETITIRQEVENLKNYESIQQYKYVYAFEVGYKIEETILEYKVPKLFLQPILENCIMHGIKEEEILKIEVIAFEKNNSVCIMITDNGKGFNSNESNSDQKSRFSGIGITNIAERIKLIYGPESSLKVESTFGYGTKVTIILPIQEKKGEKDV